MIRIKSLYVCVKDMQRAIKFYEKLFGQKVTERDEILISEGSVISKPSGKDIEHQFINNSLEILQILDIGTCESNDIITYPDENIIYIKNKNMVFNIDKNIKSWNSEPNK